MLCLKMQGYDSVIKNVKEAKVDLIKQFDDGIGMADFAILGNIPFLG